MSETTAALTPAPPVQEQAPAGRTLHVKRAPELPDPKPVPGFDAIKKEASPFNDDDWRVRFYTWCGFALRLLLIMGGVFSVMQYLAARDEKRVERALELVTLWEQPQYQEAQKALVARLDALNRQFAPLFGENPTPTKIAAVSRQIGLQAMGEKGGAMPLPEFGEHFDHIVYFLNRLSFCVEGNICSRSVLDAYFRDFALSFWRYFAGYVEKKRSEGQPNFARPIEDYVKASGGTAAPPVPATPSDAAPAGNG